MAEALADLETQRPKLPPSMYWGAVACYNGRSGRTAEARHAIDEMLQSLARHPISADAIAPVRADPRFQSLLRRVGLAPSSVPHKRHELQPRLE